MIAELVGGAAFSWLVGKALDGALALAGRVLDKRAARKAIEHALRSAVGRMVGAAPGLQEDLRSEPFIRDVLGAAVERFMDPTQPADPDALLDAFEERFVARWDKDGVGDPWTRLFGTPREQARNAMHLFFVELEDAFGRDSILLPVIQARLQRQTRDDVRVVAEQVGDLHKAILGRTADAVQEPTPLTDEELHTASADLLNWERRAGGIWMERPEQRGIVETIRTGDQQKVVLLGQPGSGKSALLSAIAQSLAEDGVGVFAIKADMLPGSIKTPDDLSAAVLNGRRDLAASIRATARSRPIVVIIDQLDAVSEMVDRNSDRMFALTRLIHSLTDCDGVRLIVSARPFEYRNDARFKTALPGKKTSTIDLGLPEWSEVEKVVATVTDPSRLSEATRQTLRNPRALVDALPLLKSNDFDDALGGLTAIQNRRLDLLVDGYPTIELEPALGRLARHMLEDGDLVAVPRPDERHAIDLAVEAGMMLNESGGRVRFAHQSWLDTLAYREVLRGPDQLIDFVHRHQGNLTTRPRIAAILRARLGQDPMRFSRELQALWDAPNTRTHVRHLLIDLSGTVDAPQSGEIHVVRRAIRGDSRAMRQRALTAIADRSDWFTRVMPDVRSVMRRPADVAWSTWPFLAKQAASHRDAVLAAVRDRWGARPELDRASLLVLEKLPAFDPVAFGIFRTAVDRSEHLDDAFHWGVRGRIELDRHEEAAELLGITCNRLNDIARTKAKAAQQARSEQRPTPEPGPEDMSPGEKLADRIVRAREEEEQDAAHQLEVLLRSNDGIHDLPEIVVRAPQPYVRVLLAWLSTVPTSGTSSHGLGKPRRRASRIAERVPSLDDEPEDFADGLHPFGFRLVEAAHAALNALAEQDSDAFLEAVDRYRHSEDELVERLLMRAFAALAPHQPDAAYVYLMENDRRLSVGGWEAPLAETEHLIRSLAPHLSEMQVEELGTAIVALEMREVDDQEKPAGRRRARRWNESDRVRLLSQIPPAQRTEQLQRRVQEGIRADSAAGRPTRRRVTGGWVRPPMSSEQMAKATDDQILGLFGRYHDRYQREPERDFLRGGSDQAAHALGEYAKTAPDRALRLLTRFNPATQQRPVGAILAALSEVDTVDPRLLLSTLDDMMSKGFDQQIIRDDLLRALNGLAVRLPGLEDRWVDLVLGWVETHGPGSPKDKDDASGDDAPTVLGHFGAGHLHILSGNSAHLRFVFHALLRREPPAIDRWLDVLEQHLDVPDHPSVWTVIDHYTRALYDVGRERSGRFLHALMLRRPEFRDTRDGAMLVAHAVDLLTDDQFADILASWIGSGWSLGRVTAGEVAVVRSMRVQEDVQTGAFIESALSTSADPSVAVGVANGAILFWHHPGCPDTMTAAAHRILVRLAPTASGGVAKAISRLIDQFDELPREPETEEILGLFAGNDEIVASLEDFRLADKLNGLLVENRCEPEIMALVATVIRVGGPDIVNMSKRTGRLAEELLPIVLSLHRRPYFQDRTLDTFEALLELSVRDADKILTELA